MSGVLTHFWQLVARLNGGDCWPRKYGLNGCIPALTSSSVGSSAIRLAEGTTVWPRCSKYVRKRRAISADSISGHPPRAQAIRAQAIRAQAIRAQAIRAQAIRAQAIRAQPVPGEPAGFRG